MVFMELMEPRGITVSIQIYSSYVIVIVVFGMHDKSSTMERDHRMNRTY